MDAESPSAASFRASDQSPRDPDPDSRPPMSLLLSAALSFFPLWGSSLAAARLAAASGSGSTRRPGSPAARALGFPELRRPRGVSEGGPPAARRSRAGRVCGRKRGCARPRSLWRPATAGAGLSVRGKERVGPAVWHCAWRAGEECPHPTLRCTHALTARSRSHR